jgi:hypothetical protein
VRRLGVSKRRWEAPESEGKSRATRFFIKNKEIAGCHSGIKELVLGLMGKALAQRENKFPIADPSGLSGY